MFPIPTYYLGHLTDALRECNIDLQDCLSNVDADMQSIMHPGATLPLLVFDRLMTQIFTRIDRKHLGIMVGKRLQLMHHGTFGLAFVNCATVRQMIELVRDLLVIRMPHLDVSVMQQQEELIVVLHDLHWQGELHRFILEVLSLAFFNLQSSLLQAGNPRIISRFLFDYPAPDYEHEYQVFAPSEIEFNHGFCGLSLSLEDVDKPLMGSDPLSFEHARALCEEEKKQWIQRATLAGRVRQWLCTQPNGIPTLSDVAIAMCMSERTLHRTLQKEGTSYRQLLDDFLQRRAKELLLIKSLSIEQTAIQLGYAETSNFRRAFKRWYGCAPSDFINHILDSH